jgi:hypothetical protein
VEIESDKTHIRLHRPHFSCHTTTHPSPKNSLPAHENSASKPPEDFMEIQKMKKSKSVHEMRMKPMLEMKWK